MTTDGPRTDPRLDVGTPRGEHPGRVRTPVIKVVGLAWLEFVKRDLDRAQAFAVDFGLTVAERTPELLRLRGARGGTDCVIIRQGPVPRVAAPVFQAAAYGDLDRFAAATGAIVVDMADGGRVVTARTPSGMPVRVAYGARRRQRVSAPLGVPSGSAAGPRYAVERLRRRRGWSRPRGGA
ncbi:hypothetical protein GTY44_21300, partial [Streptomyces sp. SID5914]|nr:hypothetical protein [Streptomyces sp. SID5914]